MSVPLTKESAAGAAKSCTLETVASPLLILDALYLCMWPLVGGKGAIVSNVANFDDCISELKRKIGILTEMRRSFI